MLEKWVYGVAIKRDSFGVFILFYFFLSKHHVTQVLISLDSNRLRLEYATKFSLSKFNAPVLILKELNIKFLIKLG